MSSISRWLCKNSSKNMFVKIVHPGGHVELHDRPILASELLSRNPKCCVAHPIVFQQPHALISPETTLLLGRKYYIVPLRTIRKLQLKHRSRGGGDRAVVDPRPKIGGKSGDREEEVGSSSSSSSSCWLFRNGKSGEEKERRDEDGGGLGTTIIGAASNESSGDDEAAKMMTRENGCDGGKGRRVGKEGDGNGNGGSSSSPGRISLLSMDNWQPGLHSICEEF